MCSGKRRIKLLNKGCKNYNLITINKYCMLQSYTFPFLKLVVEIIMTITIPNFNKRTGKVLKTIYNILGVLYVNQYNITASQLHDSLLISLTLHPTFLDSMTQRILT